MTKPRLVVIGNSHTRTLRAAEFDTLQLEVHWLKAKPEAKFGTLSLEEAEALVKGLSPQDTLGLMVLGTLHNIVGLVNHEQPFSFTWGGRALGRDTDHKIPVSTLRAFFKESLARDRAVRRLSAVAPCRVVHFMTPPPKEALPDPKILGPDYGRRSIYNLGFTPAPQRRALWEIEAEEVSAFLGELGVHHVAPPAGVMTADGLLAPDFSANDVTHANKAYGKLLIQEFLSDILPGYGAFSARRAGPVAGPAASTFDPEQIAGAVIPASRPTPENPTIWIIGDSHTGALVEAGKTGLDLESRFSIRILRFRKTKNGITLGDLDEADLEPLMASLPEGDVVISMVGGNHHQSLGLAQHPQSFCVAGEEGDALLRPERELIPRAALTDALRQLQKFELIRISALTRTAASRVFHVFSPPPREHEEELIVGRTSGPLISAMLAQGISPPEMRMACWNMHNAVVRDAVGPLGVRFIDPPREALSERGFILRAYQTDDRTHANKAYGALLLQHIVALVEGELSFDTSEDKAPAQGVI